MHHLRHTLHDELHARIQIDMEEQNAEILKGLSARAQAQIKIQHAVEGLSIIAISYYLVGLLTHLYNGIHLLGLDLSPRSALIVMSPIAVLILLQVVRRIRLAKRD